jgi:aminoacylase
MCGVYVSCVYVYVCVWLQASWTVPPFAAEERGGRVYGRGAQDMKCVCVQYLVALQRLRVQLLQEEEEEEHKDKEDKGEDKGEEGAAAAAEGRRCLLRTVRLAWVPDEEVGGQDGMGVLLGSEWFRGVAVGVALDEVSAVLSCAVL